MSKFNHPHDLPFYCVVGQPIGHSLSPLIHQAFAKSLNVPLCYERIEVAPEQFEQDLRDFIAAGGKGMNVTVPLKEIAAKLAPELSPRAEFAGAANTIVVKSEKHYMADNTDGIGLVTDLISNLGRTLEGKRILLLGAGGAVRGALAPLIEHAPCSIVIANRTISKAEQLSQRFKSHASGHGVALSAVDFSAIPSAAFDLIINGTSLGLSGKLPVLPLETIGNDTFTYDMVYSRSGSTDFTRWSLANGAVSSADGLGMLVEQAAEAFFIWHGKRPDTRSVMALLRDDPA